MVKKVTLDPLDARAAKRFTASKLKNGRTLCFSFST